MSTPPALGTLFVVATPIGNLEDLTHRAVATLRAVDLVAAEDTRTAGLLLQRLGIDRPLRSVFAGNEHRRVGELVERLLAGESIALITECGTPAISDPGADLVAAAVAAGVRCVPVPGPSAVTAVLSVCGLDVRRFRFEGFLPRRGPDRARRLEILRREDAAIVIYESPHRAGETLADLAGALGPRRAVLAREVTKLHEELVRGSLAELAARFRDEEPRGEVTLVVEGLPLEQAEAEAAGLSDAELDDMIRARLAAGATSRDLARELAEGTGRPRRELYARITRLGAGKDDEGQRGCASDPRTK
jgi:16S rRNA (cytidine1402-2'-O)-methyltransferase